MFLALKVTFWPVGGTTGKVKRSPKHSKLSGDLKNQLKKQ